MPTIRQALKNQMQMRLAKPNATAVKINMYKPVEAYGVAEAIRRRPEVIKSCFVESLMIADSVLMTHWRRDSTIVALEEQKLLFDVFVSMVADVAVATREAFPVEQRPLIMGDMPDGQNASAEIAIAATERLAMAGAETVKIEVTSDAIYDVIEQV